MPKKRKPDYNLNSEEIGNLRNAVDEAARAVEQDNPRFVEPSEGTLDRAKTRRHHIIFGRRGSGKTSLLAKASYDLRKKEIPITFVDLEPYKGHSYPDVLLSILIVSLKRFKDWVESYYITHKGLISFLKSFFNKKIRGKRKEIKKAKEILKSIENEIVFLERELYSPDISMLKEEEGQVGESELLIKGGAKVSIPHTLTSIGINRSKIKKEKKSSKVIQESTRLKEDFLLRKMIDYQDIFRKIADLSTYGNGFLFLDDLYHLKKSDQAKVLDYFHRIVKGNRIWLKIGTIRYRTEWYKHGDPSLGLKLGDDAEKIDLDITLEKYHLAKNFLLSVLEEIAKELELSNIKNIMLSSAIDRLVLASGGVARDFLAIFRRSIEIARERISKGTDSSSGNPFIIVEDVNKASGEYDTSKREELKKDTLDDVGRITEIFSEVNTFCVEKIKTNCFVVESERSDEVSKIIDELVDLRLIHKIKSRVTIPNRPGKLYSAYMLDLSQYTGIRSRRGLNKISFWIPKEAEHLRRVALIYPPQMG